MPPSPPWSTASARVETAIAAGDGHAAVAAARDAVLAAWSTEEQVIAQRLLGEALLVAGERATARAALQGALAFAVDLPAGHPAVVAVEALLATPARAPAPDRGW